MKLAAQRLEGTLKEKNIPESVAAYAKALEACTGCHAALRKE